MSINISSNAVRRSGLVIKVLCLNVVMAFVFCAISCASSSPEGISEIEKTSKAFAEIAKKTSPAVVFIKVEKTIKNRGVYGPFGPGNPFEQFNDDFLRHFFGDRFFGRRSPRSYKQVGLGSGFIISDDGYILTNNHVVGKADKIIVRLDDGREFKAKVIGTDPSSDVALIKIKDPEKLPFLPLGDSDALEVGEWVMAIGNPFGLSHTVTVGVVSAKGRSSVGIANYENFIQTDAAINPGNSGGPLINMEGQVVGINTAILSRSGGYMGIGFAIPINMVKIIKKQLLKKGEVTRGYLGVVIQDLTPDLRESFHLADTGGVLVADVSPDSPADKAGMKPGDVILAYNGKKVSDVGMLRNMVALTAPGTKVDITVMREGDRKELRVTIGNLKNATFSRTTQSNITKELGFTVQNLTKDLAQQFGYEKKSGVLITEVIPGTPAQLAGLKPGMLILEVNRHPVKNIVQFVKRASDAIKSKKILLRIQDGEYSRFVILDLD